jgi:hypothetical protein
VTEHDHPDAERWNDYLDDELDARERSELEAHVATCAECAAELAELGRVVDEARLLHRPKPPEALWEALRLELSGADTPPESARQGRARLLQTYVYPALAVAAILLLAVTILVLRPVHAPEGVADSEELVGLVTDELRQAEDHYGRAVAGLEQIIQQNDGVLAPELNAVLSENLDLIEQAIDESRAALATDPESLVAQESLLEALRRKVSLLQSTILLINEIRKGEGENALDLIDQIRQTDTDTPSNPI